ncbi:unnamed protein product, partial [Brenthis ino]
MASRGLREEEIEQFLFDYAKSEDRFDDDDDSIADPDFVLDLEVPMEVNDFEEDKKGSGQFVPPAAVRQDEVSHWPVWVEKGSVGSFLNALTVHKPCLKSVEWHYAITNKITVSKHSILRRGTYCCSVPVMVHSPFFDFVE